MEYIEGQNIAEYFNNYYSLDDTLVPLDNIFIQLINGFQYIEKNSIVHRDIREGNILIDNSGTVKIIDFGLGKFFKPVDTTEDSMVNYVNRSDLDKLPQEYFNGTYDSLTDMFYLAELINRLLIRSNHLEFQKAYKTCEFSFLLTLFGFKGLDEPGWNTYNTSVKIINSIAKHWKSITDNIVKINLSLWIYGHIMEASEPYDIIYNLLDIIDNKPYMIQRFPNKKSGAPQTPGDKIKVINDKADSLNCYDLQKIYNEIWDRHDIIYIAIIRDYNLNGELMWQKQFICIFWNIGRRDLWSNTGFSEHGAFR